MPKKRSVSERKPLGLESVNTVAKKENLEAEASRPERFWHKADICRRYLGASAPSALFTEGNHKMRVLLTVLPPPRSVADLAQPGT
jgi:hypothetical protein